MKTRTLVCSALALWLIPAADAANNTITEQAVWSETYPISIDTPQLVVSNIWGNVQVRAGKPGEITVHVNEQRSAPDQKMFDLSFAFFNLDIEADESGVSMIVGGQDREWRQLSRCRGCRVDYQLELLVPAGTEIDVGTVMDGRVIVSGISGPVSASNVNGPITLEALHDCAKVDSVNGSVELNFASFPSLDCQLETINGDITMGLPDNAGLDVALSLFNGRVVSEFDVDPLAIPAQVDEFEENGRYRYRIEQPTGVRLGSGGPLFSFTSMNGDIRIQLNQ